MKPQVILIDDDYSIRTVLCQALEEWGYDVRAFENSKPALEYIATGPGQVLILDVMLPDADGLQLVPDIKKLRQELPVIIISAQNDVLTALRAGREGVFDYLPKPFDLELLHQVIERALPKYRKIKNVPTSVESLPLIGKSPAMQQVYKTLSRLVETDMSVLIQGESGTGKELAARVLHDFGPRRHKPFIALNMAAIPKDLIESELFGFEKGAFTGAVESKAGKFSQAHGGTIFLDEIGDMPHEAQTRLLRVLQSHEFSPIGSHRMVKVDCRIIAATHRNLKELVEKGAFREDLYYRLAVVLLMLPPLRERKEDIPELVAHFSQSVASKGVSPKQYAPEVFASLARHSWPGNVRELQNLIQRLSVLVSDKYIEEKDIDIHLDIKKSHSSLSDAIKHHVEIYIQNLAGDSAGGLYDLILQEVEKPLLSLALKSVKGNQIKAAHLLGINRNTLRKKMRQLHLCEK